MSRFLWFTVYIDNWRHIVISKSIYTLCLKKHPQRFLP